jgi:arsenite/tail-anchored protein-transporting ATPase
MLPFAGRSNLPAFTFFIGKGGVGKTTTAAAYATWRAATSRRKLLLISTDPAHSLADIFQSRVSDRARRINPRLSLFAREIDAAAEVRKFLSQQREGLLSVVESGTLFSREEVAPLLDAAIPGMSEIAALLVIHSLLKSKYDEVVLDTAPMGHTLRLFEMPAHFARFVEFLDIAASRNRVLAAHFGGSAKALNPTVVRWREMVDDVVQALSAESTRLVLVSTPENFSLNESARARDFLRSNESGMEISTILLNRAMVRGGSCVVCKRKASITREALKFVRREFPGAEHLVAEDAARPILGISQLRQFGTHVFAQKNLKFPAAGSGALKFPKLKQVPWPVPGVQLALTAGKGGVGKTTVSAGLAVCGRQEDQAVTICSIDPSPSLDDVFETQIVDSPVAVLGDRKLQAIELDALQEYRRWADRMSDSISGALSSENRGLHVDLSFDRDVLLALLDVVPPGVDEIFALFRLFDLMHAAGKHKLIIDMSPTGHALELLRTPDRVLAWCRLLLKTLAAHRTLPFARDAAVEIAAISQRVRELASRLRDKKSSEFYVVMLAEPLPGRETLRLINSLQQLSAPVAGIIVNRVLISQQSCSRCRITQQFQVESLNKIIKQFRTMPLMFVSESAKTPAGRRGLERLTKSMWRLA